jgi:large subunit ribosomal protein L5
MKNKLNIRTFEDYIYNYQLDFLTKFNIINNLDKKKFLKITLNFGFKEVAFDKKKMIPFFFILELISNQKCAITTSKKDFLSLKIKKGSITGCKVTLRNRNLYNFLDTLILALPRYENFKGFFIKKLNKKVNNFSISLLNLFIFHSIESELLNFIKKLDINFMFNTTTIDEKIFLLSYNKLPIIK